MPTARHIACLILASLATPTLAQEAADPAAELSQDQVSDGEVLADLALWALKPVLEESGQPLLDAQGEPVEDFQPVTEGAALLPGDQIRYVLTLSNEGADADDLALALDLPAEGLLLPESVTSSVEANFELGSSADTELRVPLLIQQDGTTIPNPTWATAPDGFDHLHATINRLAANEAATVTYDLVVR